MTSRRQALKLSLGTVAATIAPKAVVDAAASFDISATTKLSPFAGFYTVRLLSTPCSFTRLDCGTLDLGIKRDTKLAANNKPEIFVENFLGFARPT